MRRADRLFRLVQLMRSGKLWTAARLADAMEVSERTVYRDIADLSASGVPIEGAAGVGYIMRSGFDIPPLMFTQAEVTALALGARMVAAWGGPDMADGARDALSKIEAVVPRAQDVRDALDRHFVLRSGLQDADRERLDIIDGQIRDRLWTRLVYVTPDGTHSDRRVQPLGLWFWGKVWTLVAWCELRGDFRMFRIDRIGVLDPLAEVFPPDPDRSLAACMAQLEAREGCPLPVDPLG
ncbi:helix-turn-helix transcriptional regulator [Jannaschia donghaensis]|uniref:HTH domain protein n=1 Tax=Jannaschia donghaensis TaxID=420998 RepID=A0A0M6YKH0_9RHOB|nr:YafY family protein [Jannaschia donghaensis]CTQ50861.1 HTH domain protein [Jannaschia donghaensis]